MLRLISYRVLENDDEGDPLDHGTVLATDTAHAIEIVTTQLGQVLGDWSGTVRFYDHGAVPAVAGFVESIENSDVHIDARDECADDADATMRAQPHCPQCGCDMHDGKCPEGHPQTDNGDDA